MLIINPGLEILTNTVAFARESFPFATKISANLGLVLTFALSKLTVACSSCHFAATFSKIYKEMTFFSSL